MEEETEQAIREIKLTLKCRFFTKCCTSIFFKVISNFNIWCKRLQMTIVFYQNYRNITYFVKNFQRNSALANFTPCTDAARPRALFSGAGAANFSLRNPEYVALGPGGVSRGRVGGFAAHTNVRGDETPQLRPRPAP